MSRRGSLLVAAAAVLALLSTILVVRSCGDAYAVVPSTTDSGSNAAAREPLHADLSGESVSEEAGVDEAVTERTELDVDEVSAFRGRVLDEAGEPRSDVVVEVRGFASRNRLEAFELDHGPVEWENPATVTTRGDGRFEVLFVPPPPYQFSIVLSGEGCVLCLGFMDHVEAGSTKDFGDIEMPVGVRVSGRFVDRDGAIVRPPDVDAVAVSMRREDRRDHRRGDIVAREYARAEISPDGTFVMTEPVQPGRCRVDVQGLLPREQHNVVDVEASATSFDLVVWRPEDLLRLSGVVVDENGRPIADAWVRPIGVPRASSQMLLSARDGGFELVQRPAAVDPERTVALRVECEGYQETTTPEYSWGATDVRVVLERSPVLEVLVVRAADRQPVEEYGLRVLSQSRFSSQDREVIDGWTHEHGLTRVTTLQGGGRKRVFVESRDREHLASVMQIVEVDFAAPPRITVELPPARSQKLRVQFTDGRPVVGSTVELIDGAGTPIRADTLAVDFARNSIWSSDSALLLDSSETDARGEVELFGPVGRPVVVRCRGDHPPVVLADVVLADGERVVEVPAGATLRIQLEPLDVLAAWRESAGISGSGPLDDRQRQRAPTAGLVRQVEGGLEWFPVGSFGGVPFDENGVVVLEGVPSGIWTVRCTWSRKSGNRRSTQDMERDEPVDLAAGETREVVVDASAYRTGSVSGTLNLEGASPAGVQIVLTRPTGGTSLDGQPTTESVYAFPDEDGRFALSVPAGEYVGFANVPVGALAPRSRALVRLSPSFVVGVGDELSVDLAGTMVRATVRVLDPSGDPVPGIVPWPVDVGVLERPFASPTDADGLSTIVGAPGTYTFACPIRTLLEPAALRARSAELRESQMDFAAIQAVTTVRLPAVTIGAGDARQPVELRLPADWDR